MQLSPKAAALTVKCVCLQGSDTALLGNENREGGGRSLQLGQRVTFTGVNAPCIGFHSCDTSVDYVNEDT